ncbi:MAG: bifunctional phosphopantothenoylcysteine decarboxylase/phosphopantothenate--cysteine ligase CoaBC [Nitrospinae bacterium]|nr:bifunctional phosphopantothenoylcysteine decarboxylase/phosphopantothenate--cysteine ligase CoaBC [Nitrospinota bacterium]
MNLKGKTIILGVCGGIAAYKAVELTRLLKKDGADVWVVMTRNAREFVAPLTFQTLSGNPVYSEMFLPPPAPPYKGGERGDMPHIDIAKKCNLLLIAPATANIIGKFAGGIADDLLSTLYLSVTSPVLIAPAMNNNMYANPVVKDNIKRLKGFNINFIDVGVGELACGDEGEGRLAEPDTILSRVRELLFNPPNPPFSKGVEGGLKGKTILVTAGPTHEAIDPVRFISNHSSGKTGYAVASAAQRRGGKVILISGPTNLAPPSGVKFIPVKSADDMRREVLRESENADVIVMAAAVSDFSPVSYSDKKIKKEERESITLELKKTPDILEEIQSSKLKAQSSKLIVGFALETEDIVKNAKEKLKNKHLDFIIANSVNSFGSDSNKVAIIDKKGNVEDIPLMPKDSIAEIILDKVAQILKKD